MIPGNEKTKSEGRSQLSAVSDSSTVCGTGPHASSAGWGNEIALAKTPFSKADIQIFLSSGYWRRGRLLVSRGDIGLFGSGAGPSRDAGGGWDRRLGPVLGLRGLRSCTRRQSGAAPAFERFPPGLRFGSKALAETLTTVGDAPAMTAAGKLNTDRPGTTSITNA